MENTSKSKTKKKTLTTKMILKGKQSKAPVAKIPKAKFENALKLIKAPREKQIWMESCIKYDHASQDRKHDITKNMNTRFLSEARICLLKRDWTRLAKILTVARPVTDQFQYEYMTTYLKYAAICLYHNYNHELVNDFLKGVCLRNNKDDNNSHFFKALTRFPS